MHPTHRFFFFSFLLAAVFIFANLLSFFIPADNATAQTALDNRYSAFIQIAYNDSTGISYYCPTGFTSKGYFKPDVASTPTVYDVSNKSINSGWVQLCVNNGYSHSVIARRYDDYNPWKNAFMGAVIGSVTAGTASGISFRNSSFC
ncbi:MAG: hypothetical protein HYW34_02715 [Candidatus Brennerbacteria bacterium]|nr:hypothetical protein [Candidatus Brennerbacteria bacterium]